MLILLNMSSSKKKKENNRQFLEKTIRDNDTKRDGLIINSLSLVSIVVAIGIKNPSNLYLFKISIVMLSLIYVSMFCSYKLSDTVHYFDFDKRVLKKEYGKIFYLRMEIDYCIKVTNSILNVMNNIYISLFILNIICICIYLLSNV